MEEYFACIGMVIAILNTNLFGFKSKITNKWINELIECPICLGLWIGLITFSIINKEFAWKMALCVSLGSYVSHAFIEYIFSLIAKNSRSE